MVFYVLLPVVLALHSLRLTLSFAADNTDRRFIFIIQRGAADGLNTVIPYADPAYAKLRGALAIDVAQATKLDGMFALHASMDETAKLYIAGQAAFVHAVSLPHRDRSHFDAQNVLETGGTDHGTGSATMILGGLIKT